MKIVKEQGYKGDLTEQVVGVFARWCFDAEDEERVALGLRLHVLDVWVDELEREGAIAAANEGNEDAKAFVEKVGALVETLKRCPVKSLRQRAADSHDDERLPWAEKEEEEEDEEMDGAEGDGEEWDGLDN